jgi:adenylate cyclase
MALEARHEKSAMNVAVESLGAEPMSGQVAQIVHSTPVAAGLIADRPSHDAIRAQMDTMLAHGEFNASARNRRFLSYVVEETLQGRGARIKAYTIALAVFERGDDFDPLTDPIVRIEASRLRRAIEHYYLTVGKHDQVRIDMPKGSYVPTFSIAVAATDELHRTESDPSPIISTPQPAIAPDAVKPGRLQSKLMIAVAGMAVLALASAAIIVTLLRLAPPPITVASGSHSPSVMVLPFETASAGQDLDYVALGMTYEIISKLTQFEDFFVYGPRTAFSTAIPDKTIAGPDYLLTGSVQTSDQTMRVNVVLTEQESGRSLWAWSTEEKLSTASIIDMTNAISQRVVNMVAQPDGVILEHYQEAIARQSAPELTSYECVIRFRHYWRGYDRKDFEKVEACLKETVASEPDYAPAHTGLALLNIDRYRFGFGGGDTDGSALAEAVDLATRAQGLEPRASHPYLALSLAYWFQKRVDASIATAERGLALNPNNAELLADLGLRYALLAKWDKAIPLVDEAYERDPAAPSGYRVAHFLHAYMLGAYERALVEAERIDAPYVIYGHVARAAAYGQLGDVANGASAVADILRIDPEYGTQVRRDLAERNMAPAIIDAVVDGLKKAGLSV